MGPLIPQYPYLHLHTNRYVMTEPSWMPEPDIEYKLALRLLNQDPPLDRRILEQLVGRPHRYNELKPLLKGRNDNVLTKALARIRDEGLISQGLHSTRTDERRYQLTELGKLVVFRIHEMLPYEEIIAAHERAVRASA